MFAVTATRPGWARPLVLRDGFATRDAAYAYLLEVRRRQTVASQACLAVNSGPILAPQCQVK
jgi:hypothetical protein